MALGGSAGDVFALVFRQGMLPVGVGLVFGLLGALGTNRLLASQLVQVEPADLASLAAAAFVLISAAVAGCAIPAARTAKIDPIQVLREQ